MLVAWPVPTTFCWNCGGAACSTTSGAIAPRGVVPTVKLPVGDKPRRLFGKAVSINGTPAERYLVEVRGSLILPPHSAVRFMPALPPKFPWPVMVSAITDFADAGKMISLHFTDLLPDGSGKAPTDQNKHTLAGYPMRGGVIRLVEDAEVTTRLGVAEGIEKALSIMTSTARPRPHGASSERAQRGEQARCLSCSAS